MALKDLLLYLDGGTRDEAHLKLCVELASAHDAALTGLFVGRHMADGLLLDAPPSGVLIEALEQEREARRSGVKSRFDKITRHAGVRCQLSMEDGDPVRWIGLYGRCADLVIVGQSGEQDDLLGIGGIPGGVALSSNRPVLMIPRAGVRSLAADRVIVAWNNTREATRAINDALPILQKAGRVEVITIGANEDPNIGPSSLQMMSRHLWRHGIAAKTNALPQPAGDTPEVFLDHANRNGADLVVMGAYGRSRLQEFVLGGMTRQLLNYSPVPLFLSH